MFYILVDTETQTQCMTFTNFSNAQLAYNRKRRESDGTRAWQILFCEYRVDPENGNRVENS